MKVVGGFDNGCCRKKKGREKKIRKHQQQPSYTGHGDEKKK